MKFLLSLALFSLLTLLFGLTTPPVQAETSVNVSNSSSTGNCNNHVRIESNGVVKEINSTDCSDISLSVDSNGNSTSSPNPTSSPAATTHPTATPRVTASPTPQPTDTATPSATPTASDSATPTPTPVQNTWIDKILDGISGFLGKVFGGS